MDNDPIEISLRSSTPRDDGEGMQSNHNDIDEIFTTTGQCSRFQIIVQVASIYLSIAICWNFVLSFFAGTDAGWRCINNNSSRFCEENQNKSFAMNTGKFYHRCKLARSEWRFTTLRKYSFTTEFDLVCEKRAIAALVSSSYYIGGLIGSVISGTVADTFGRKPVLLFSIFASVCSSIGGSFVNNVWHLFTLNIVQGAASVACYFTVFVYQLEFVSPAYRALSGSFLNVGMVFSYLLIDLAAYYEREWRKLQIYTSLPCILSFFDIRNHSRVTEMVIVKWKNF